MKECDWVVNTRIYCELLGIKPRECLRKDQRLKRTYAQLDETPVGPLSFSAGDNGLLRVAFATLVNFKQADGDSAGEPSLKGFETVSTLLSEMNLYLAGLLKEFSVSIDWDVLDGFQRDVLSLTAEIPYGEVLTYGAMAEKLGDPGAARAVGMALGRNPMPIVIPCHRLIGADHSLHGYIGGNNIKSFLLSLEGHTIINDKLIQR
jgi:methylated-DNA-[protein]-cysteine S-methyltransferase